MGLIITDGTGKGNQAAVGNDNRLEVDAVTATTEHFINHEYGRAYSMLFQIATVSGGSAHVYIKNTAPEGVFTSRLHTGYPQIPYIG